MFTECDEVAASIGAVYPVRLKSYTDALELTRAQMPDESETIISNVAWSLWQAQS